LKDAEVKLTSGLFVQAVPDGSVMSANRVASQRLDIVRNKVLASLESSSVNVNGSISVKEKRGEVDPKKLIGFIHIKITQKETTSDGRKPRKLDALFGQQRVDMSVYDNFVNQISTRRKEEAHSKKPLRQQVDDELKDEAKSPSSLTE
jgi:chemotaxis protein MotB